MTTIYQEGTAMRIQRARQGQRLACRLLTMLNELEILAIELDREDTSAPYHQAELHAD